MASIAQFFALFGYCVFANVLTPLPSDIVSLTLGYFAALYHAPFIIAACAGIVALAMLDAAFYSVFRFFGMRLGLIERIIDPPVVESFRKKMTAHLGKTVLFLRFYPGPGILSPVLAGALKIPFARYFAADLAGIVVSVVAWAAIGDVFHGSVDAIRQEIGYEKHLAFIVMVVLVGLWLSWRMMKRYVGRMTARRARHILAYLKHHDDGNPRASSQ